MNKKILLLISVLFFFSCGNKSIELKKDENGVEYFFYKKNDHARHPKIGEGMVLDMQYYSPNDSLLFDTRLITNLFKFELQEPSHEGGCIERAMLKMGVGDSARFLIQADSFFIKTINTKLPSYLKAGDKLRFEIKLVDILSKDKLAADKAKLNQRKFQEEQRLIDEYVRYHNISEKPTKKGIIFIENKKGTGKKANTGDSVVINYTGYFINDEKFDSSFDKNKPLDFKIGSGIVIAGLEEAVALMNEGGKAKVIIPSSLAYSDKGYKRIVPPYATLIFEIELVKVK